MSITPPRPANFDSLRSMVRQDWADTAASEQRTAAVRELAKKYVVKYEVLGK